MSECSNCVNYYEEIDNNWAECLINEDDKYIESVKLKCPSYKEKETISKEFAYNGE